MGLVLGPLFRLVLRLLRAAYRFLVVAGEGTAAVKAGLPFWYLEPADCEDEECGCAGD
jgi:hypothetical protein